MDPVIGIDLGTTNSCVAVVADGVPTVIANRGGYRTTPSMVAIADNGRRLVGHIAKRQSITNAENTVYASKRLIGRKWNSQAVSQAKETLSYPIAEGPNGDVRIQLRDKTYSLPEISSMVLGEMKMVAEQHLGGPVTKAVITVPAYFNDGQRQATKDAGAIAGLEVLRIINEPTAAALAYGHGKTLDRKVAIFDLGGGTFDISILNIANGVFEVVATAGDTYLGGEDFDNRIIEWLVFGFAKEHQIDLRKDKMALQRLKDAAEKAKCELSGVPQVDINLPFIISTGKNDALHMNKQLTREAFEGLVADLCDRCFEICEKTLKEAGVKKEDLQDVILVGGMTRVPKIQEMCKKFFALNPSKSVNPDEVVALGASIQGVSLVEEKSDMLLLDVTPHNLGIQIAGGYFQTLIEKNTTVPTSASAIFTTVRDNQTTVKILVVQGDAEKASDNEILGEFTLSGLREGPRGSVKVEVQFEISADGIVSVSAKDQQTGQQASITVTATTGLSPEEVQRMSRENEQYAVALKEGEALDKTKGEVESLVREIEKILPSVNKLMGKTPEGRQGIKNAEAAIQAGKDAVQKRDVVGMVAAQQALERALSMFRGLPEA